MNKTELIQVKVTKKQKEQLIKNAEKKDLKLSEYIREKILKKWVKGVNVMKMNKFYNFIGKCVVFITLYVLSIFTTYKIMIFMLDCMTVYK